MRLLLVAIVTAALGWSGYWFVGARAVDRGANDWFGANPGAEAGAITLNGFPNRFDLTVTEPRLADAASGLGWSAPFIQIFALSYQPHHVIAVWPHEQSLHSRAGTVNLASEDLRASLVMVPGTDLAADRTTLVGQGLRFVSDQGWTARVRSLRAATRRNSEDGQRHDLVIELEGTGIDPDLLAMIDPAGVFPPAADLARIDMTVDFDAPLDRFALRRPPMVTRIELVEARLAWGPGRMALSGDMTVDQAGLVSGALMLSAEAWQPLFDLIRNAGLLDPDTEALAERSLAALAALSDEPENIELPLRIERGAVRFGPVLLGHIPPLTGF